MILIITLAVVLQEALPEKERVKTLLNIDKNWNFYPKK